MTSDGGAYTGFDLRGFMNALAPVPFTRLQDLLAKHALGQSGEG